MTDLKYCKNCKHCRPDRLLQMSPYEYAICVRPSNDLVSGGYKQRNFCRTERISYSTIDTCGIDAKYYYETRK
jgi:hypothetical protein